MKSAKAAKRYAKALFELATQNKKVDEVLGELRELSSAIHKDKGLSGFFSNPLVTTAQHTKALEELFSQKKFSEETKGLLMILAKNKRLDNVIEVAKEFQSVVDAARGVTRGTVASAATLFPEDRQRLEATISKYTGKKAVLEYHENKSLLGGMVAQVGSYTFDDSLETQLRLMKDALTNRRSH